METRAPYALIGLFVLAAIGAVFGFVYWLNNTGGLNKRTVYVVRFENTVSGLLPGAAVLFNGIRVGEVTDLQLNPNNPRQVLATIAVATETPVRPDTYVGLEFQGLDRRSRDRARGPQRCAVGLATGRAARSHRRSLCGFEHDSGGPRRASPRRHGPGGELRAAARDHRQSQHVLGRARAQFRPSRCDRGRGGAHDRRRARGGATRRLRPGGSSAFPPTDKAPAGLLTVLEPTAIIMFDTQKFLVRPSGAEDRHLPTRDGATICRS